MKHSHLSLTERHYIEIEMKRGISQTDIAKLLQRSQSTISREISRNEGLRGYRHKQADNFAQLRHLNKPKAIKLTEVIKQQISDYLHQDWSPEQIAGRLKIEGNIHLHHETIYQFILADKKIGGQLYRCLRHQGKTYRKRYGSANNRTGIPNRVDIDQRPEEANQRLRVGDWEADTIIGKGHQGAIVTLDERVTKLRLAMPTNRKQTEPVCAAITTLLTPIKTWVKTMTFDNGKEFAHHDQVAKALDCDTYFAKAYHSWERGQNENANGLLRQYFPKAMALIDIPQQQVVDAVHKLNSRPRKCLEFLTPYEAFLEATGINMKNILGLCIYD